MHGWIWCQDRSQQLYIHRWSPHCCAGPGTSRNKENHELVGTFIYLQVQILPHSWRCERLGKLAHTLDCNANDQTFSVSIPTPEDFEEIRIACHIIYPFIAIKAFTLRKTRIIWRSMEFTRWVGMVLQGRWQIPAESCDNRPYGRSWTPRTLHHGNCTDQAFSLAYAARGSPSLRIDVYSFSLYDLGRAFSPPI